MVENQMTESSEFDENLKILREVGFFSTLPLEALKVFAYLCRRETFKPGEYLFQQDDADDKAFYIVSGKTRLVRQEQSGEVELRGYSAGEFLGGLALIGDMRRLFSLKATEDTTCVVLTRKKFAKVVEQFPDLVPRIQKALVDSVRAWEERLLRDRDGICEACKRRIGVSLV
jgi:CRP-like cAMP-binding protein